jgi:hypothetical protein
MFGFVKHLIPSWSASGRSNASSSRFSGRKIHNHRSVHLELEPLESRALPAVIVGHYLNDVAPETFVIGLDNQVYAQKFDANGNPLGIYSLAAFGQVKAITAIRTIAGTPEVLAIGLDNQVYGLKFNVNGDPVGGYALMGFGQVKAIAAAPDFFQSFAYFVLGLDNRVYGKLISTTGDPTPTPYGLVQPGLVKTMTVGVSFFDGGSPQLFVIGLDDQVYAQKFTSTGVTVGGYFLTTPGAVKSISFGFSFPNPTTIVPEIFAIGLDDQIYAQKFTTFGDPSTFYFLAAPGKVKEISVGIMSDNTQDLDRPQLFVIGLDNQVYSLTFSNLGDPSGGYFLVGPGQVKSITGSFVCKAGTFPLCNDFTELFVIGLDNQVYIHQFDLFGSPSGPYILAAPGQVK